MAEASETYSIVVSDTQRDYINSFYLEKAWMYFKNNAHIGLTLGEFAIMSHYIGIHLHEGGWEVDTPENWQTAGTTLNLYNMPRKHVPAHVCVNTKAEE
jgi:hypothetical protein